VFVGFARAEFRICPACHRSSQRQTEFVFMNADSSSKVVTVQVNRE
jgi:hypothetical protein